MFGRRLSRARRSPLVVSEISAASITVKEEAISQLTRADT